MSVMKRRILKGAAIAGVLILGGGVIVGGDAIANSNQHPIKDATSTYQQSPDCRYPPCD